MKENTEGKRQMATTRRGILETAGGHPNEVNVVDEWHCKELLGKTGETEEETRARCGFED